MRRACSSLVLLACLFSACSSPKPAGSGGSGGFGGTGGHGTGATTGTDAGTDAPYDVTVVPPPDGSIMNPCNLPGSVQFTTNGTVTVPGGDAMWPSLAWLHLPMGFCAHYYGSVNDARQLRFAPGGELFVASPTTGTTSGGGGGLAAIVVLPDDNLDGVADSVGNFLGNLPSTQGMMFAPGYFYYQDHTMIMRMPYATGDRTPSGPGVQVADITYYVSALHWPKTLDMADDGNIYMGNGGDQNEQCVEPHPFHGGILQIDAAPGADMGGIQIAQGLRNPISVRCSKGHNSCYALELALDYSAASGGREKLIPIRKGDDWGFPCCATTNLPYQFSPAGTDCSKVAQETNSFVIGDTPFDLDFEQGFWPGTWNRRVFVVTHGAAGSWTGARMVAIPTDPTTGAPLPSTDTVDGGATDGPDVGMNDFATGWDDGTKAHGRPAAVAFAPDGRLFVANDTDGVIFWIAPL
jgi:glucose/arabinose dehydrogenase